MILIPMRRIKLYFFLIQRRIKLWKANQVDLDNDIFVQIDILDDDFNTFYRNHHEILYGQKGAFRNN